ncbi:formate dehydrogenase accessory sulfurtransferase FdhD [Variovorax sp. KK3]|uniref:formate dehydrogenase accessory sulfurtransferase FdhD n=1 Tax=Variovorax sp. KK3 TaxID=1855728 RepID=UPI00097C2050|nr:formate dehydrogenase accessory sulfurtransferase FdhD [Variovorax sp. KK3]
MLNTLDARAALPSPLARLGAQVLSSTADGPDDALPIDVTLAAEVPVALVYNGISHAVMLATPQDLEAFALGFSLSEGILDRTQDCFDIEVRTENQASAALPAGVTAATAELTISARCFDRLKRHRRSMAGRTGCGVCGVDSFAGLELDLAPLAPAAWARRIDAPQVLDAIAQLPARQVLNAQSGAIHAAGWAHADGTLNVVFEDIGRHNALDKLLGELARSDRLGEPGFVVLTSRGSHELVRKCVRLGVHGLATISAPTAMGVQMALQGGLRFWGMCRPPRALLYAPGR